MSQIILACYVSYIVLVLTISLHVLFIFLFVFVMMVVWEEQCSGFVELKVHVFYFLCFA